MRYPPNVTADPPDPRDSVIDLFAGPGGLDVAAHWLGIRSTGIEWDSDACTTRTAAVLATQRGDVREHNYHEFPATTLAAGPPCQTFTVAGSGKGRSVLDTLLLLVKKVAKGEDVSRQVSELDDVRTGLVLEPLKWAVAAHESEKPYDSLVFEQVPSVLPIWAAMAEALDEIGYHTFHGVLHTEEFGVPQTRRRAVLIARRKTAGKLRKLTRSHSRYHRGRPAETDEQELLECVSMRDALSIIPNRNRPTQFELVSNYGTGGVSTARGVRDSSLPAYTITGKASRNRIRGIRGKDYGRLTVQEAGVLQTFPHDYPWSGRNQSQQVGNAIPPRMGVHILTAALGLEFDARDLDAAVARPWRESFGCIRTRPA